MTCVQVKAGSNTKDMKCDNLPSFRMVFHILVTQSNQIPSPSDLVVGMVSPFQQCSVAPDQCSDAGLPMVLLRKTISDLSCLQTV